MSVQSATEQPHTTALQDPNDPEHHIRLHALAVQLAQEAFDEWREPDAPDDAADRITLYRAKATINGFYHDARRPIWNDTHKLIIRLIDNYYGMDLSALSHTELIKVFETSLSILRGLSYQSYWRRPAR